MTSSTPNWKLVARRSAEYRRWTARIAFLTFLLAVATLISGSHILGQLVLSTFVGTVAAWFFASDKQKQAILLRNESKDSDGGDSDS